MDDTSRRYLVLELGELLIFLMGNEIPASRKRDGVRTSDQGMRREHPGGGAEGNVTSTEKQRTFRDVYMLQGRIGESSIRALLHSVSVRFAFAFPSCTYSESSALELRSLTYFPLMMLLLGRTRLDLRDDARVCVHSECLG